MSVRLWPTLPKDTEANGLAALERPLLDDPAGPFYFIAEVNRRRATIDDDEDATTPTIRVLHGEALLGEFSSEARELLKRAQAARLPRPRQPDPTLFDGERLPGEESQPPFPGDPDDGDAPDAHGDDADGGTPASPRFLSAVPDGTDGE